MMFLLKSNVPRLVWHHVDSFDWKIAPIEVASAEIGGVRFVPWGALCQTLLYNMKFKDQPTKDTYSC